MEVTHITFDPKCVNNCFLNASLQALLGNTDLRNGILELDHNFHNCQGKLYHNLFDILLARLDCAFLYSNLNKKNKSFKIDANG